MNINLLRQCSNASGDGLCALDRQLRYLFWNDAMEQIYGFREDQILGQPAVEMLPFLTRNGEAEALHKALDGQRTVLPECLFEILENQRTGISESTYQPLYDDAGRIIGVLGVIRDITKSKAAARLSQEMETRFYRMADCSPVLLWMAGTDGLCNFFNQTWLNFTDRTLDQEYGVGWAEGVHPFDFQFCVDTYLECFNARRAFEMEYRLMRADGEYRWILDRGAPRYNLDGSFAGFIGSCTDITERKNLETALQDALSKANQANRLKSEFLANISHELRTPLNAIVNIPQSTLREFPVLTVWECEVCGANFEREGDDLQDLATAQPLSEEEATAKETCPACKNGPLHRQRRPYYVGDAEKTVHFLQRLLQSGQHLLSVVNDLLDFSKLDAGRLQLFIAPIDVSALLSEVSATISPLAEEKQIQFCYTPAGPLGLCGDRVKLAQVFLNIIGNAIKFTPPEGRITVEVAEEQIEEKDFLRFAITDTGIGIPKDKQSLIFESFTQADGGHTRSHQGTGLGLSITKRLVELHGGKIWVQSEVGIGSSFIFVLPKIPPGYRLQETSLSKNCNLVLVVDDECTDLEVAGNLLEAAGFEVSLLVNPEIALRAAQELQPVCIILDVLMPQLSGLAILQHLKENPAVKSIPVLISTAYYGNREVVEKLGGIWLPKPWNRDNLIGTIRSHIHQHQQGNDADRATEALNDGIYTV